MNDTEAIEILERFKNFYAREKGVEALNHAITALQKHEDGLMVELPCKVGDKLFLLDDEFGNSVESPIEAELEYWFTGKNGLIGSVIFGAGQCRKILEKKFGKTVFLTKAEAEAAKDGEQV